MIIKSYEVKKNSSNLLNYNFFLLYGENFGLKKDVREFIKTVIKQKKKFYWLVLNKQCVLQLIVVFKN